MARYGLALLVVLTALGMGALLMLELGTVPHACTADRPALGRYQPVPESGGVAVLDTCTGEVSVVGETDDGKRTAHTVNPVALAHRASGTVPLGEALRGTRAVT